ncbi:MAG: NOG1 family protein [Halobacteriaceae archaeon]
MIFEGLPTAPTADELLDTAFSRAARTRRAKEGHEAQESMLQTATNVLSDNLENVVNGWPDLAGADPFYREVADALCRRELAPVDAGDGSEPAEGVDALRRHLSEVAWASRKVDELGSEYRSRLRATDRGTAQTLREQAFARMADVVEEVADDLDALNDARQVLRGLPDVRTDEPVIVVAGVPNVGKSSFVNHCTNARIETDTYPFTSREPAVGHATVDRVRYQLVDTPGLLDRPAEERNEVESQAASALAHLADCVLIVLDASGACGYPLESQLALADEIEASVDAPALRVCNKADRSRDVDADLYMSVTEGEGVEEVLRAAVEAVDYEPPVPSRGDAG